jgi:putative sigma-54 modulation protein
MEIKITARHFELTDALRNYVQKEVFTLKKYFNHLIRGHMILSVEKHRQIAELVIHVWGTDLAGKGESEDMYLAIDEAVEKMERQVKRYKDKLRNHKSNSKIEERLVSGE